MTSRPHPLHCASLAVTAVACVLGCGCRLWRRHRRPVAAGASRALGRRSRRRRTPQPGLLSAGGALDAADAGHRR